MEMRALRIGREGDVEAVAPADAGRTDDERWLWIDVIVDSSSVDELVALTARFDFDALAVRDAVDEVDLPKVDDFGHHLLVILHGLREDAVATYELDCFLAADLLVTVHGRASRSIDAIWTALADRPELGRGGPDEMLARIADTLTRRMLTLVDAFDERAEALVDMALTAHGSLVAEVTAARADLRTVRRVVHPQREVLDELRRSPSELLTSAGRRRFSDVFDVASRAAAGLDTARSSLAEILDAYRGAEARAATDVSKVLTIYAAIMLPLSIVTGFFGMNFVVLPGTERESGWWLVLTAMGVITVVSLGVFVSLGWIRRPSGRAAGKTLSRGLLEAARAPAQVAGAVFELSTMPIRATTRLARWVETDDEDDPVVGHRDAPP